MKDQTEIGKDQISKRIPSKSVEELSELEIIEAVENEVENFKINRLVGSQAIPVYERRSLLNRAIQNARVTIADATLGENIILSMSDDEKAAIATVATFILVKGRTKVGKTNAVLWIVSVLLGQQGFPYAGHLEDSAEIFWADTEQSRLHIAQLGSTIGKLFGLSDFHPRLTLLSLRPYSFNARWHLIDDVIKSNDRIKVVVIDNLADLVGSILDDREASELFGKIIRLIEARKVLVIAVLHTNKTNSHSRGHLGSLAEQFAECVLDVHRKDNFVYLNATLTRNAPIPTVAYRFNGSTFEFLDAVKTTKDDVANKKDFHRVPEHLHTKVLAEIFKDQAEFSPAEFRIRLSAVYAQTVTPIGLELVKKLQSYYVKENLIVKDAMKLKRTKME